MPVALEWTVEEQDHVEFKVATALAAQRGKRLPTSVELVECLKPGDAPEFTFGAGSSVLWCSDGGRIDPMSDEVAIPGPAPEDAKAAVALVEEREVTRPTAPQKQCVEVHGYLDEATFQKCVEAARFLNAEYSDEYQVTIVQVLGFEYEQKRVSLLQSARTEPGSPEVPSTVRVLVYDTVNETITTGEAFLAKVTASTNFRIFDLPDDDPQSYRSLARVNLKTYLGTTKCNYAWFLVKMDDQVIGRIVFQLYSNICPKTCLNFLHLCRGDLADTKDEQGNTVKLGYKGSTFYRIVKNGWIQGGDITGDKRGNGGRSIYGRHFPDETFDVAHDAEGTLGMANDGEHTNSSSFYITMKKARWMDSKYVAFGRVVEGLLVVRAIHDAAVKHNQTPQVPIVIDECGDIAPDA